MKDAIKNMLTNLVGEEKGQEIFNANFPEPIDGYMPGKILTLAELRLFPEDTIIHIRYIDEDGNEREDGFQKLIHRDETEWSAGAYPFPIDNLKEEELIDRCDNSGWTFTIREVLPAKKGEFEKMKTNQKSLISTINEMQEVHQEFLSCQDKQKKKELKTRYNQLEKQFRKMSKI